MLTPASPGIYSGGTARVTGSFTDVDTEVLADVVDPVVGEYRHESWDEPLTFDVAKVSTGTYRGKFIAGLAGLYMVRFTSSGDEPAVAYGELRVLDSGGAMSPLPPGNVGP